MPKGRGRSRRKDVIVVGAGISGIYCAWQLGEKHPDWKIHVYDALDRVGGRLHSIKLDGISDFRADLGAMRFRKKKHRRLYELIQELGLDNDVIPFNTPEKDESLYFLRETLLTPYDVAHPSEKTIPYQMTAEEYKLSTCTTKLVHYWTDTIRGDTKADRVQENCEKGVMNALLEVTSRDAVSYLAFRDLHNSDYFSNSNFAKFVKAHDGNSKYQDHMNFYPMLIHSEAFNENLHKNKDKQLFTLKTGFQQMVINMKERFQEKNPDRHVLFNSKKLIEINFEDGNAQLLFEDTKDHKRITVSSNKVILAIPSEALAKVHFRNKELRTRIHDYLVAAISETPAMKTFLVYDKPWWRDYLRMRYDSNRELKVIGTDDAVGTILDYGIDSRTGKAVLLCYSEWYTFKEFWESVDRRQNSAETKQGKASPYHLELINNFFQKIFDLNFLPDHMIPKPTDSACVVWHTNNIGCAWHSFNAGYDYNQVMEDALRPVDERDVYVVGESFSDVQGWCEGALHTAQNCLHKYFDFKDFDKESNNNTCY